MVVVGSFRAFRQRIASARPSPHAAPTVEEIRVYVQERDYHVDPELFVGENAAVGWPAVDWRRVVEAWECNWRRNDPGPERSPEDPAGSDETVERLCAEARATRERLEEG